MKRMTRREFAAGVAAGGAWAAVPGRALAEVARAAGVGAVGSAWPPDAKRLAADPLRPQFHLLPKYGWMNDPNAPVYWRGKYHMFFQYNPGAAVWGDMHWAHAWSEDMVRWKHLPVALSPTVGGYDAAGCFTGSFIEDAQGKAAIVYTGVANVPEANAAADATLRDGVNNFRETQCLAGTDDPMLLSWDQGRGSKAPAPVIARPPEGMAVTGFRDPSAWKDGDWYYMTVGSGIKKKGGMVLLYRSPAKGKSALLEWEYLHPLAEGEWNGKVSANAVDTGEMWECPDFFALDGWWVLLYSTAGEVIWETGRLDAKTMRFERVKRGLLDAGAYYAPKSQLDAKGSRILWGWLQETRPAAEHSAAGWAGCMSLPRRLNVAADGVLEMRVDAAVDGLRGEKIAVGPDWSGRLVVPLGNGAIGLRAVMDGRVGLALKDASGVRAEIGLRRAGGTRALLVGDKVLELGSGGPVEVRGYFDGSVLEVIADNRAAVTVRSYGPWIRTTDGEGKTAAGSDVGGETVVEIWKMKAISGDRLTT